MIRAVGFDLDDTLAVTERDRKTLLRSAADRADVSLSFDREDYLEAHRDHSGTESRRPIFEALGVEAPGELTRTYREAVGEALTPIAGTEALFAGLGDSYRLGLLTDGPAETQRDKLRLLGWEEAFDAVVVTGAVDAPKPDPEAFVALADALGVDPAETVYVGNDPERDIAGAAAVGMVPIQVLYEGSPGAHTDAVATLPRAELRSLSRLLEELECDRTDDA